MKGTGPGPQDVLLNGGIVESHELNGVPIDDDDMETEGGSDNELLGTGQPWLDLDEDHASNSTTSKKTVISKEIGGVGR